MATSGTVDQTIFTTQEVIDHAYRRMKMPAELISGEKIDTALRNLWLILQDLGGNKGCPVWEIETQLRPLYQGLAEVDLLPGTVQVLNANLRTLQRLTGTYTSSEGTSDFAFDGDLETACTQVAAAGNIELNMLSEVVITTFGILPRVTGLWDFVYEISLDGVTWITVETFTQEPMVARQWLWTDVQITRYSAYQYARVRATGATVLDVIEWYVANTPQAIPMAPMNKDDYFNLPNKSFQGRPVQFWQDMRRANPVLLVWPVPNDQSAFQLIEAQAHRAIQDVGSMTQQLDIPNRWFNWVVWSLAEAQADEDPDFKGDINRLEQKKDKALRDAQAGIVATGPIFLQPNISHYTRA